MKKHTWWIYVALAASFAVLATAERGQWHHAVIYGVLALGFLVKLFFLRRKGTPT